MRPRVWLLLIACGSGLTACRSQEPLLIENYAQARKVAARYSWQPLGKNLRVIGFYAAAPGRGRQAKPTGEALLTGQVSLLLENGNVVAQPGAFVRAGSRVVITDEAGRYKLTLVPGRYALRAGGVGLLASLARPLQVAAGDSIQLNFELLAEFRPTYN